MVLSATFTYISVISWRSVLLVEETQQYFSYISLWSVLLVEEIGVSAEITDLLRDCVFETTCIKFSFLFNLESYNVDHNKVSISGISSGAVMATQMHVIHSADIMGVGIIAGGKSFNVKVTGT